MLSIVTYPHPILQQRANEVGEITKEISDLFPEMMSAMRKNEGIGLAAPQIGLSSRIIIVQDAKTSHAFLNPEILSANREMESEEEGCLSLPGIFLPIKRARSVSLRCTLPSGKSVHIEAEGLLARIFQHEIDHLNGMLIIHRAGLVKRWKARKRLRELESAYKTSQHG